MSNALAIATSTEVLRGIVDTAASTAVPGATAKAGRPEDPTSATGALVTIFLYQVTRNSALGNDDLPIRRADGSFAQRPRAALDLHYLLSFYGDDAKLVPQRMLGRVVARLHGHPFLERDEIAQVVHDAQTAGSTIDFLATSDLAQQVELVKFTPTTLNLEELSKLWSVFFRQEYALSVTYVASLVVVEDEVTAQEALPVRRRVASAGQAGLIYITGVEPQSLAWATPDPILTLTGTGLALDDCVVRFGAIEAEPNAVREESVAVAVPAEVPAGVRGVQLVERLSLGEPPTAHRGRESNLAWFVREPAVQAIGAPTPAGPPGTSKVTVAVQPAVGASQDAVLLLNERRPPASRAPRSYTFPAPESRADALTALEFEVAGVESGTYLVRVRIDGAESPLTDDPAPPPGEVPMYDGPQVTFP